MQRSDVLTGLSIRLGPALKIYERHIKVLQRTHFMECEELWLRGHGSLDRETMLRRPPEVRAETPPTRTLPHTPSYAAICRGWTDGEAAVEATFTVRLTTKKKTVILPLIMVFGFHFTRCGCSVTSPGGRAAAFSSFLKKLNGATMNILRWYMGD